MAYLEFEPKNTLFQFTSVEALKGIIQSRKIWFSDLRSLNDPREIVLGLGRIRPLLEDIVADHSSDWDISRCGKILDMSYETIRNTDFFTCSFSQSGDSMPLWHNYAQDGAGVAIGFRPRALRDIPCRIQKVDYVNKQTPLEDLQCNLVELFASVFGQKGDMTLEKSLAISSKIISLCTSSKHSTWNHEHEIRGVYTQPKIKQHTNFLDNVTSVYPDDSEFKWQEPNIRENANGEVKYIPFGFGILGRGEYDATKAISKIVVGSKSNISVPEIEDLLSSEGYRDFEVILSECIWQ